MSDQRVVASVEVPGGDRDEMKATARAMFTGLMGSRGMAGCRIYIGPCKLRDDGIWVGTATLVSDTDLDEEGDPPPPDAVRLMVSTNPQRTGAVELAGTSWTFGTKLYVFVASTLLNRVSFSLDGAPPTVEATAPWDFAGGGDLANPSTFTRGSHVVIADCTFMNGQAVRLFAPFTIS